MLVAIIVLLLVVVLEVFFVIAENKERSKTMRLLEAIARKLGLSPDEY